MFVRNNQFLSLSENKECSKEDQGLQYHDGLGLIVNCALEQTWMAGHFSQRRRFHCECKCCYVNRNVNLAYMKNLKLLAIGST